MAKGLTETSTSPLASLKHLYSYVILTEILNSNALQRLRLFSVLLVASTIFMLLLLISCSFRKLRVHHQLRNVSFIADTVVCTAAAY